MPEGSLPILKFRLDGEEFGVSAMEVERVLGMVVPARIPMAPAYVAGALNLGGEVLILVDLRIKFGTRAQRHTKDTRIIVVEAGDRKVGFIVDSVSDIESFSVEAIDSLSSQPVDLDREAVFGIARTEKGVLILLDLAQVLSSGERERLETCLEQ